LPSTTPFRSNLLLAITGGIAAYKAAELTRLLVTRGADVRVAMTEAATRFITPTTMQALSGQAVWTDLWDARVPEIGPHGLARQRLHRRRRNEARGGLGHGDAHIRAARHQQARELGGLIGRDAAGNGKEQVRSEGRRGGQ